jgi:SepF-like predicted cell division protein (DUF552 family)
MGLFTKKNKESKAFSMINANGIVIKQITINSSRDFTVLRHNLLEGNIMVCNLKPLVKIAREHNNNQELHSHLQQIKHYCLQNGGNVAKIKESLLLITPNNNYSLNAF